MKPLLFLIFLQIFANSSQTLISLKELQRLAEHSLRVPLVPQPDNVSGKTSVRYHLVPGPGVKLSVSPNEDAHSSGTDSGETSLKSAGAEEEHGPEVMLGKDGTSEGLQNRTEAEEEQGELPDMKYFASGWGLNLTASYGKKGCNCGHRRTQGAVPVREVELNRRANATHSQMAPRIAGGEEAILNEFPWRVALTTPDHRVFCGGSIIDNAWILTSARCVGNLENGTVFYVNAGDHDISTMAETDNVYIKASEWIVHPAYDHYHHLNDIAVVRLQRELTYRANIQPICLPYKTTDEDLYLASVVTAGWGVTEDGTPSDCLLKVDLPIMIPDLCSVLQGRTMSQNLFCTKADGKDACEGDLGGTVDLYDPDTGRYHAVGIISHGNSCGKIDMPRFYTKVPSYLQFIQDATRTQYCIR